MSHMQHRHAGALPTRGHLIPWAQHYDRSVSLLTLGRRAQLRQATIALADIAPGAFVLEVGCGTGDVALAARPLAGAAGRVIGIDPSPGMLAVARAKAARAALAVDFHLGVIEALAFPAHTFDLVLSSLMMHHLPEELKIQGLAEIARVLKPGGRLVVVDFMRPEGRVGRAMLTLAFHHGLERGIQDLPALLGNAGFVGIEQGALKIPLLGYVRAQTRG